MALALKASLACIQLQYRGSVEMLSSNTKPDTNNGVFPPAVASFTSNSRASLLFALCSQVSLQVQKSSMHSMRRGYCRHLQAIASTPDVPEGDFSSLDSDETETKIDLELPRRRVQITFTCNACGFRSQRIINPHAYARGTVFVQCAGCEVYHKLVDNLGLIEEYDFRLEKGTEEEQTLDLL